MASKPQLTSIVAGDGDDDVRLFHVIYYLNQVKADRLTSLD